MNETLGVIDEHMADMAKPNRNRSPFTRRSHYDYSSEYAESADRLSYIQGSETEEEEESKPTREQVMKWTPQKVADYLEDNGVERRHCDVFIDQEISGEVVLSMDQATLFMKDLDLGPIGRRLKTWNRIKDLQEAVKPSVRDTAKPSARANRRSMRPEHYKSSSMSSANQSPRPSAASIRSLGQARRQSSIDATLTESPQDIASHNHQASLDRGWTMNGARHSSTGPYHRPTSTIHSASLSADRGELAARSGATSQTSLSAYTEADRGYLSAAEPNKDLNRNVLRRGQEPGHDRSSSATRGHDRNISAASGTSEKRRMSFFGTRKSPRPDSDIGSPAQSPVVSTETHPQQDGVRVVSEPGLGIQQPGPVTIEPHVHPNQLPTRERSQTASDANTSAARKGLRAISDAITGKERSIFHKNSIETATPTTASGSPRSSTPSGATKSFDFEDANKGQYSSSTTRSAPRRKTKKETSAYTLGLEKKAPQEQIANADYSGWMKKKSSNLMANWKPRLFVLRGRRLAYYYSDTDTEEKGLIDISGHRVLSADNERLTGLHASLTGAKSSPTSPNPNQSIPSTTPGSEDAAPSAIPSDGNGFIFKLVPPRSGMSRAVNFTKPTVHYFAVPSIEEGRLWMAALMKATIDRDDRVDVVTTYQQKTISLAKARARKERPPALQNLDEEEAAAVAGQDEAVDDAHGHDLKPAVSNTSHYTAEPAPPDEARDQITEVTDLESPISRSSLGSTSKRESKRRSSMRKNSANTAAGLGIDGVAEPNPMLERLSNAGLW